MPQDHRHHVLNLTPIEARGLSDPLVPQLEIRASLRDFAGAPKELPGIALIRTFEQRFFPKDAENNRIRWTIADGPLPRLGLMLRVRLRNAHSTPHPGDKAKDEKEGKQGVLADIAAAALVAGTDAAKNPPADGQGSLAGEPSRDSIACG